MGGDKNVRTTRHSVKVKMREERTPAIVLRSRAHGESDKIVTFLTRDWGKVTGIAKGAKRSRHRFVNVLEAFTQVQLRFRPGRAEHRHSIRDVCEVFKALHELAHDAEDSPRIRVQKLIRVRSL